MTQETRNILIGALVVMLGAGFLVGLSRDGAQPVAEGISLQAVYQSVDGVSIGTDVMLGGISIGKVVGVNYVPSGHRAALELRVRDDIPIPTDSVAMIVSTGMLGGKYIKLAPGGEERTMKDGDQFEYVQGAVIFEELLQKVVLDAEARRLEASKANEGKSAPDKPNPFGSLLK